MTLQKYGARVILTEGIPILPQLEYMRDIISYTLENEVNLEQNFELRLTRKGDDLTVTLLGDALNAD